MLALALPVIVMGGIDCGGATTCTTDADCVRTTNARGDEMPFCNADQGICGPDQGECTEDLDCRLLSPDSATSTEDQACAAYADCSADERCIETTTGFSKCATVGEQSDCAAVDTDAVDVTDVEGGDASVCLADGICGADGGCTFTAE